MAGLGERTYTIGGSTLTLRFGDLTRSDADVLVSSDDTSVSMGGGVSAAILRAGGQGIMIEAAKHTPAALGSVVVTTAGALRAKYVFHAITIGETLMEPAAIITAATGRCLQLLDALQLRSIAFPAIGAGVAGFAYEDVAVRMAETIVDHVAAHARQYRITIYLYDPFRRMAEIDFLRFFEEFAVRTRLAPAPAPIEPELPRMPTPADPLRARKQRLQTLARLDQQRELLEVRIANSGASIPADDLAELRRQLAGIQNQRIEALTDMPGSKETHPISAFIAYAHEDEPLRITLGQHLSVLEHQQIIGTWFDRKITAGSDWNGAISEAMSKARLVLLLISRHFMNSSYCRDVEMRRALERHKAGECLVIPVMLRPFKLDGTKLAELQVLPTDAKPIETWPNVDLACIDVVEGVQRAVEEAMLGRGGA